MEMKHSPGPWRFAGETSVIAADGYEVGCIWKGDSPNDKPRDDANARLVVAAPRLLAALQKIAKMYPSEMESSLVAEAAIYEVLGN
jgi:hypothetical protein